ncbi:hypothetical protein GCM10010446_59740 [Streptomyces enissocaesilis]|uniref:Uncharacterized protein n=1 Tax=Streptomyces enissocaesilis TaxID=332589 RepID=A0ABP6K3B0_9ACTN
MTWRGPHREIQPVRGFEDTPEGVRGPGACCAPRSARGGSGESAPRYYRAAAAAAAVRRQQSHHGLPDGSGTGPPFTGRRSRPYAVHPFRGLQEAQRYFDVHGPGPLGAEEGEGPRHRRTDLLDRRHPVAEGDDPAQRLLLAAHLVQHAGRLMPTSAALRHRSQDVSVSASPTARPRGLISSRAKVRVSSTMSRCSALSGTGSVGRPSMGASRHDDGVSTAG